MTHYEPRAILRDDRALIFVPEPLRVESSWDGGHVADAEVHLTLDDYAALARQMPGEIHDFMEWIISLDSPDPESQGFQDRRTTTMTDIIRKAREAMGTDEG